MHNINRLITNLCSDKLAESKAFYTKLFAFQVAFDSDWFVQLQSVDGQFELGIIDRAHEIVPEEARHAPQGCYITIVVDDADKVYATAQAEAVDILSKPHDTFYGQRRLLLRDPNGVVVDVSSPTVVNHPSA